MEQNKPIWKGDFVEFQAAVLNAPVQDQIYPRILVGNDVGTAQLQVNLVSRQRAFPEVITYKVVPEGTTAIQGIDFEVSGSLTFPPNSSIVELTVEIINTGAVGGFVDILLELEGNETIKPSPNYKQVQLRVNRP